MALIQLDTRVPLATQAPQIDFGQLANNTLSLYDNVQQRGQQGVLSRLLAQNMGENGQPDLNKALQAVQSNPRQAYQPALINTLSGLLKQQRAEELKAQQDAEKFKNDSAKTIAETEDKRLGNTQKGQTLLANLIATSTDATDAARKLATFGQQYGLPKDLIDSTLMDLKNLVDNNQGSPEAFQAMQKSFGLLGSDKPIEYLMPNANNVLDNETSVKNNILNNQTSAANNAATVGVQKEKIIQDQKQFDAEAYVRKNKPLDYFTAEDGTRYAVYEGGQGIPISGPNGQPIKVQQKQAKLDSSALKQVNEYNTQLTQAKANQIKIGGLLQDLQSGRLVLSPQAILAAEGRSRIGQSTPNDLAIDRFNTALNQSINDVLMMAKGTQTEGDANRAAQVIRATPPRDNASALQALRNLALIAKTNITALDNNLNTIYANFGMERPQVKKTVTPGNSNQQNTPEQAPNNAIKASSAKWGI